MQRHLFYVWTNRDGVVITNALRQWIAHLGKWRVTPVNERFRMFVAGGPLDTFNDVQIAATVKIMLRREDVAPSEAVFYDGHKYANARDWFGGRPKVLRRVQLAA